MYELLTRTLALQVLVLMSLQIDEVAVTVNDTNIYFIITSDGTLAAHNEQECYWWDHEAGWYGR